MLLTIFVVVRDFLSLTGQNLAVNKHSYQVSTYYLPGENITFMTANRLVVF